MRFLRVLVLGVFLSGAVAQQQYIPSWLKDWESICYWSIVGTMYKVANLEEGKTPQGRYPATSYTPSKWYTIMSSEIQIRTTVDQTAAIFFTAAKRVSPVFQAVRFERKKPVQINSREYRHAWHAYDDNAEIILHILQSSHAPTASPHRLLCMVFNR
jgi:hypothetical protein